MRKVRFFILALIVAVLAAGCGGGDEADTTSGAPATTSATPGSAPSTTVGTKSATAPDACSLLDAAAVSAAFGPQSGTYGSEFGEGHPSSATPLGNDGSACEWSLLGESGFTLVVDGANLQLPFDAGKSVNEAKQVSGVCDDAYFEGTNLVAIKDGVYLHGSVNNVDDTDDRAGLKKAIDTACDHMG